MRVPAGADFLWSDLKTRIHARPRRFGAQLNGRPHIWHSVSRVAFHDDVAQKKKKNPGGEKKSCKQPLQK